MSLGDQIGLHPRNQSDIAGSHLANDEISNSPMGNHLTNTRQGLVSARFFIAGTKNTKISRPKFEDYESVTWIKKTLGNGVLLKN